MIYLDNAATGFFKPDCVKKTYFKALNSCANPGRGGHAASVSLALKIEAVRNKIKNYFNAEGTNVIFTKNCTEALNLAILGSVEEGSHVITTMLEHNSVLRPLYHLASLGKIELTVLKPEVNGHVSPVTLASALRKNTKTVVLGHVSNVTGAKSDIQTIGKILAPKGITYIVDGAQSVGHCAVDFSACNIDMLCAPAHKGLFAPQGLGFLIVSDRVRLRPISFGGTGTESDSVLQPHTFPEGYECGTLNSPAILALGEALDWLEDNGRKVNERCQSLTAILLEKLDKKGITLYTDKKCLSGVVSFNLDGASSSEVGDFLNERGFCVRTGLHCAPLAHEFLGTLNSGTVRVSPAFPNTEKEIEKFVAATFSALRYFKRLL